MADLSVKVCGVEFNNPLIAASGTFGFGMEYSELYPLEKLGGISCKGITLTRRDGNPVPRVAETPSGILNAEDFKTPVLMSLSMRICRGSKSRIRLSLQTLPATLLKIIVQWLKNSAKPMLI